MNDRPKTIPELRGYDSKLEDKERTAARVQPYSAKSYSAQYGIAVEDAEEILTRCNTHEQVHTEIMAEFINDPELRLAAIQHREIEVYKARRMDDE